MIERKQQATQLDIYLYEINKSKHIFEVELATNATEEEILMAKIGAVIVWEYYFPDKQTTFKIVLTKVITDLQGNIQHTLEMFHPGTDKIIIATESVGFKEFANVGFNRSETILLLTAHATMHRVQIGRGKNPINNEDMKSIPFDDYFNSPGEKEAWDASLHAVKHHYPNSSGSFKYMGHTMTIPEKSKFK